MYYVDNLIVTFILMYLIFEKIYYFLIQRPWFLLCSQYYKKYMLLFMYSENLCNARSVTLFFLII